MPDDLCRETIRACQRLAGRGQDVTQIRTMIARMLSAYDQASGLPVDKRLDQAEGFASHVIIPLGEVEPGAKVKCPQCGTPSPIRSSMDRLAKRGSYTAQDWHVIQCPRCGDQQRRCDTMVETVEPS